MGTTPETVVIIGSNSFSGSHTVALLLGLGLKVHGISRSPEPDPAFRPYSWQDLPGEFSFHQLDLNQDGPKILAILDEIHPDRIINFAAQGMVAPSWESPPDWFQTNVLAHIRLVSGLRNRPWLKSYVNISTPEVYGATSGSLAENRRYDPSTPYAVSKAATDMFLHVLQRHQGFPVVFTRAGNVFGPGQQLYRIVPKAILSFLNGKTLDLHGGGTSRRSFVYIRDVVEGTWLAATKGRPGEIFHLATDQLVTIRKLVETIAGLVGGPAKGLIRVGPDRPGKDAAYELDSGKARRELGWAPRISLLEGLEETIRWVRTHSPTLSALPWEYRHKP